MNNLSKQASEMGKKGGKNMFLKYGIEHMKKISKLAMQAKKKKRELNKQNENL